MDLKRNQFETRVATLELVLVTERARPKPNEDEIEKLEKELAATKSALQKYNEENPQEGSALSHARATMPGLRFVLEAGVGGC